MDTSPRGLETLDSKAFDEYIDGAIDQLFVPRRSVGAPAQTGAPADEAPAPETDGDEVDPLEVLQESLLSLDWEVSPKNIVEFEQRVGQIGERHADDRNVATVVQMVAAVCKYLVARGDSANALGVQFPSAAVRTLELLLAQPATPPQECRAAVARLHEKYRLLQAEAKRRGGEAAQPSAREQAPESPSDARTSSSPNPQAPGSSGAAEGDGETRSLSEQDRSDASPDEGDAQPREATEPDGNADDGGEESQPPAAASDEDGEEAAESSLVEAPGADAGKDPAEPRETPETQQSPAPVWLDSAAEARSLCVEVAARLNALCSLRGAEGGFRNLEGGDELDRSLVRLAEAARAVVERVPPAPGGDSATGSDALSLLGGLVRAVGRIERHLGTALPPAPAAERPASTIGAPVEEGLTVSIGDGKVALAQGTVVRALEVPAKKAQGVRERGYATLADFCGPFGSVRKGISGPLVGRSTADLKRLHFRLVEGCSETGQVVIFLSDGQNHRALLADDMPSPSTQGAGCRTIDLSA